MFNKTTEYSIRVILLLGLESGQDKLQGVSSIAAKLKFPEAFIGKVLQSLVKIGLIGSIKGPGGGFYILKDTYSLTVLDILERIEGLEFLNKCGLGINSCNKDNPCPIHEDYNKVSDSLINALSSKTIYEINQDMNVGKYDLYIS